MLKSSLVTQEDKKREVRAELTRNKTFPLPRTQTNFPPLALYTYQLNEKVGEEVENQPAYKYGRGKCAAEEKGPCK